MTAIAQRLHRVNEHDTTGLASSTLIITRRAALRYLRTPQLILMATVQMSLFSAIYRYMFGGAIHAGSIPYVDYLVPGFIATGVLFSGIGAAVATAEDLEHGFVDRLRSLPIPRSSVLAARAIADTAILTLASAVTVAIAFAVGFRLHGSLTDGLGSVRARDRLRLRLRVAVHHDGPLRRHRPRRAGDGNDRLPARLRLQRRRYRRSMPGWLQVFAKHQPLTYMVDAVRGLTLGSRAPSSSATHPPTTSPGRSSGRPPSLPLRCRSPSRSTSAANPSTHDPWKEQHRDTDRHRSRSDPSSQPRRQAPRRLDDRRSVHLRASHGLVVLDLLLPEIEPGEIEIALDIDHTTLKLLVPDGAVIDDDVLRRVGRVGSKTGQAPPRPTAAESSWSERSATPRYASTGRRGDPVAAGDAPARPGPPSATPRAPVITDLRRSRTKDTRCSEPGRLLPPAAVAALAIAGVLQRPTPQPRRRRRSRALPASTTASTSLPERPPAATHRPPSPAIGVPEIRGLTELGRQVTRPARTHASSKGRVSGKRDVAVPFSRLCSLYVENRSRRRTR